jgi:hypothetical protein
MATSTMHATNGANMNCSTVDYPLWISDRWWRIG